VKLAAIEGHWHEGEPGAGTPGVLVGFPDAAAERNAFEVAVPRLGGLILKHDWNGTIQPLSAVPADQRPPVAPVFWAFRVMVGLGLLMLALAWLSLWKWRRGQLGSTRWLLDFWRLMSPTGFIALLAGWYVVEIGRQPWTIYGVLRTSESVSPNITAAAVWSSLVVYAAAYAVIFGAGIWYLRKLMLVGPVPQPPKDTRGGEKTPARPLSVPDEPVDAPAPGQAIDGEGA
jgi:cytochrome d ubiquinol oxidase subunit I